MRQRRRRERLKYQASPALDRARQRLGIHVRDHQQLAARGIGRDAGHQPVGVEFRRERAALLDRFGRAALGEIVGVSPARIPEKRVRHAGVKAISARPAHQRDEAHLLLRIVAEQAGELRGDGERAGLLHAAHRHAGVLGLDHHGDAARLQDLVDRGRDLRGQVLLRLQAPRVDVDQPRDLGQADDAPDRHIGDMRLAGERHHVMLAMRIERNIAHQHEVVVAAGFREGAVEHLGRAFLVAGEQLLIGVDETLRRLDQALRGPDCRRYRRAACAPRLPPRRARGAEPPAAGAART